MKPVILIAISFCAFIRAYSWGSEGHRMIVNIAYQYLDSATKDSIDLYLGTTGIESASTWMDEIRSDHLYDYMKPWHYINIEKGEAYIPSENENILNVLLQKIDQLKSRRNHSMEENQINLKILLHLVGDLHQPLHVGYGSDKGGNTVQMIFNDHPTNLHKVWDTEIIEKVPITKDDCLKQLTSYPFEQIRQYEKTDLISWMNESRNCMNVVYGFNNHKIDKTYIDKAIPVIEHQILTSGLRLAQLLHEIFEK